MSDILGWMQTGRNADTDGDWAGSGSKANFKSEVKIIDPEGNPILYDNIEDGQQSWDLVTPGSKLEWKVNTDGHDDRVSLKLTYWDMKLFLTKFNETLDSLSPSDKKKYENGDKAIQDGVAEDTITAAGGIGRLMVDMWSDIRTTDGDGNLTGTIDLDPTWPKTLYFFNAHYGYAADEESSNWSKTGWAALEAAGWAAMAVAMVLTAGTAAIVFGAIATTVFVIELGKFANKYVAIGYGPATENKYGDQFPQLGFNHTYTLFMDYPEEEEQTFKQWGDLLNDDNIALIDKANIMVAMIGLTKLLLIGGLLVFLIHKKKSRRG